MKKLNIIAALTLVLILIIVACKKNKELTIISKFEYSEWTSCNSNKIQTRTYRILFSANASDVPPADSLERSCVIPCTSFIYSVWTACTNSLQTRTYTSNPIGCGSLPPQDSIKRNCGSCSFVYSGWTPCTNNLQTRTYTSSPVGCSGAPPADSISRSCVITPTLCTFVYNAWSACSNGVQTRIYTASPSGCSGTPPADSISRPCVILTTIQIGTQNWTLKNLEVTTYANGETIPQEQNPAAWANLTTGAWCYFNNTLSNGTTYGKLYNWYAVNDPRGLAPYGYHIPTDVEWSTLITSQGGTLTAGGKLKEYGVSHWLAPNTGATNSSGFTGLPGGYRSDLGSDFNFAIEGNWWTKTQIDANNAKEFYLVNTNASILPYTLLKKSGLSVRCLKD